MGNHMRNFEKFYWKPLLKLIVYDNMSNEELISKEPMESFKQADLYHFQCKCIFLNTRFQIELRNVFY